MRIITKARCLNSRLIESAHNPVGQTHRVGQTAGDGCKVGVTLSGFIGFCLMLIIECSESKSGRDPDGPWLCGMDMQPVDSRQWLPRDTRGVVITDVVVLAIRQIHHVKRDVQIIGELTVDMKVGGDA